MPFCLLYMKQISHKLDNESMHVRMNTRIQREREKNYRQRCGGGMKMTNTKQVVVTHTF